MNDDPIQRLRRVVGNLTPGEWRAVNRNRTFADWRVECDGAAILPSKGDAVGVATLRNAAPALLDVAEAASALDGEVDANGDVVLSGHLCRALVVALAELDDAICGALPEEDSE